ncbi:MAG: PDZ domain-containing protein, partial [Rhodospirillales bacterium]|nr:PDZ domain-containing protein [Rhodospirillales bacterium]
NRGNSGGPMFNIDGDVVGVNSAIYSPSGGSVGIGFAIPSSTVQPIIAQLRAHGQIRRGWLGVQIQPVTDEIAESLGLENTDGALVADVVENGPAAKANIKAGDIILTFNGTKVSEMRMLPRLVAQAPVDAAANVGLLRRGKRQSLDVKIEELQDKTQLALNGKMDGGDAESPGEGQQHSAELGMTLSSITGSLRQRFNLATEASGLVVTDVDADGAAIEKGIRAGDIIVEVGQEKITSPKQFAAKIEDAKKHHQKTVLLLLDNEQGQRYVALKIKSA